MKVSKQAGHTLLVLALLLFCTMPFVKGHGKEKHAAKKTAATSEVVHDTAKAKAAFPQQSVDTTGGAEHAAHLENPATAHATPQDFPNLHPLLVHFPIVLLLLVAVVQLCNIYLMKRDLDWLSTIVTAVGFGMAFYVSRFAHPHTTGLTAHAKLVLQQHDHFADWTIYLSGASLLYLLLHLFRFKGKRWSVAIAALLLCGAAYTVAMAGHYGAQLVHIEGVGPQGKYLETGHPH